MLGNRVEEDFRLLHKVNTGRLSPDGISVFFWGAFMFGMVMTGVALFGMSENAELNSPLLEIIIQKISIPLLVIQLLFTLFFTYEKNAFRFQRLQMILLSFISIKLSLDAYQFFFVAAVAYQAPSYVINTGLFILIGGIIYLLISLARGIRRFQNGEFKKDGKGLYDFKSSKGYVVIPIIYAAAMLGGSMGRNFSDPSTSLGLYVVLLLCATIQYGIAMAWPEFFLLTHAKLKFNSFIVKTPKRLL
ncbi:hypothetical protein R4Z10_18980 [Niallia sp. XMNu-256]|uniref:hypothetical protein n=1 Tax=Niallia sp. XMNu-256 TaxID=3082444 RepID=UPI0030D3945F